MRGTSPGAVRHFMVEDGTHCNPTGNVVPAMVVSWLLLRYSSLQGTPPGTVRDRVAPTAARAAVSTSRRPLCTRTTQISLVLHQARPAVQALYDGGRYSLQRRRERSVCYASELVVSEVQQPAGHTARSSQGPSRADRSTRKSTPTVHAHHSDQAGCGSRHGPPCRHSMMEGSTHCNDTGNVVFATLVS